MQHHHRFRKVTYGSQEMSTAFSIGEIDVYISLRGKRFISRDKWNAFHQMINRPQDSFCNRVDWKSGF